MGRGVGMGMGMGVGGKWSGSGFSRVILECYRSPLHFITQNFFKLDNININLVLLNKCTKYNEMN